MDDAAPNPDTQRDVRGRAYRRVLTLGAPLLVPASLNRIPGGLWMYAACKPLPVMFHKMVGHAAERALRTVAPRRTDWIPPMSAEAWRSVMDTASRAVGRRVADVIVQLPADERRRRFNVVLLDNEATAIGFAKFTTNTMNPLEIEAMRLLNRARPESFVYPRLLDSGALGEWSYRISSHLPPQPHGPAWLDPSQRRRIVAEIQTIAAPIAEAGSFPVHGDFGPWNVRRLRDGSVAVIDWEEMTTGPKAADDLWHAVHQALIRNKSDDAAVADVMATGAVLPAEDLREAAHFWVDRHDRPEPAEVADGTQPQRHLDAVHRMLGVMEQVVNS